MIFTVTQIGKILLIQIRGPCKGFKTKCLGKYYDLYAQSDTLLLAAVFENFRNTCLEYMNSTQLVFLGHQD